MPQKPYPVAILQGRLSPDLEGTFQFFPPQWREEFPLAGQLGFTGIEWLVDSRNWRRNPIFIEDLRAVAHGYAGVPVCSIGADWFMREKMWEGDADVHRASLGRLVVAAKATTNRLILVPFLEENTIRDPALQRRVVKVLKPLTGHLKAAGVRIAFETELPAGELVAFVDSFGSDRFGVYFDTGNCTSYGFDCPADIGVLGRRVMGVHVKDRKVGASRSLPLGQGDTDFAGILRALRAVGWQGTLVLQGWRGPGYVADAAAQKKFLETIQQEVFV